MEGQCKATVFDRFHNYGCSRKAGYGPGGEYCKQHAREYLMEHGPVIKTMYKVYTDIWEGPEIIEVGIVDETDKLFYIKNTDQRYVDYSQKIIKDNTDKERLYETKEEALKAFMEGVIKDLESIERDLKKHKERFDWAIAKKEEINKNKEGGK